jgi:hypothetical protein
MERPQAGTADRADGLARIDTRSKQGLGGVDVSQPGHDSLIEYQTQRLEYLSE